jgi:hypothetical protein
MSKRRPHITAPQVGVKVNQQDDGGRKRVNPNHVFLAVFRKQLLHSIWVTTSPGPPRLEKAPVAALSPKGEGGKCNLLLPSHMLFELWGNGKTILRS